jgi:hypothetical protein
LSQDQWGNLNIDAYGEDAAIKLSVAKKEKVHTDSFMHWHDKTIGDLSEKVDGRYILACPQTAGTAESPNKTVSFTITRPKEMTEFGGEWVKLYPKDSWENVTNEYEPWTMNQFGSKIPLLRYTPEDTADPEPEKEDHVTVYMEVSDIGDFEVKYGNPQILTWPSDGSVARWVAVEFKSTLLRVGSPWAECSGDELGEDDVTISTIIPAFFGHPNLNVEKYQDLTAEVAAAHVNVTVVVEVFSDDIGPYSMSEPAEDVKNYIKKAHPSGADYTKCYVAGNPCPEGHAVCKSKHCELDKFEKIIRDMQKAGALVLGAVGTGVTPEMYDLLDSKVDGFFFLTNETNASLYQNESVYTVAAPGIPLFDKKRVGDVDTYVTLISNDTGLWNPYSWYPHEATDKWAAIVDSVDESNLTAVVEMLIDRGYGNIYVTDQDGFNATSTYNAKLFQALANASAGVVWPPSGERRQRRLQSARSLQESPKTTYKWGCDDTLFACSPVCLGQTGVMTTIAEEVNCAGEPMDPCQCKCYYDAQWVCTDSSEQLVECQAKRGVLEAVVVGDLVCENRGTPKPACGATPKPTTRGSFPTQQCLEQWVTTAMPEEVEEEPTTAEPVEETVTTEEPAEEEEETEEPTEEATEEPAETTPVPEEVETTTAAPTTPVPEEEEEEAATSTMEPSVDEQIVVLTSFATAAALALVVLQ